MKRTTTLILSLILIALVLAGCSATQTGKAPSVGTTAPAEKVSPASTPAPNPYGAPLGTDVTRPYPVIDKVNEALWVKIDYMNKNEKDKVDRTEKYYGIGRGFVSQAKLEEGKVQCEPIRFKKLSYPSCTKYPYSKLALKEKSSSYTDDYDSEAYLEEENFRGEKLDLGSDGVYDIVFLENKTQTANLAENGIIFDIFLNEGKLKDLDQPNKARGTISYKDESGQVVTEGLTIREILENCGQPGYNPKGLLFIGGVLIGPGSAGENRTQEAEQIEKMNTEFKKQEQLPKLITLTSLKAKKDEIKKRNRGRETLVDDFLTSDLIDFSWRYAGVEAGGGQHPEGGDFGSAFKIDLDNLVDDLSRQINPSLGTPQVSVNYNKKSATLDSGFLNLRLGDKVYLYKPSQEKSAVIEWNEKAGGEGLGIGFAKVTQEQQKVKQDPWCGFTPECKPAIYLYPKALMPIQVKIGPAVGHRTITIPSYDPQTGWRVLAEPNGTIYANGQTYSHLFYEAMTPYPTKPERGWIIKGSQIDEQLLQIGSKLSLNSSEAQEMSRFWAEKLSPSPYYFVGLLDVKEIEALEPLSVTPKPDSLLRVRLYFAPLKEKITVEEPSQILFVRNGFTVVEWGGYVGK